MGIRSDRSIYQLLEKQLRAAKEPITCAKLMETHEIREAAIADFGGADRDVQTATNKLSDTLGFMWRRGLLTRYHAPRDSVSFARYAYTWADQTSEPETSLPPPVRLVSKRALTITEHPDGVELDFDKLTIYVRPK